MSSYFSKELQFYVVGHLLGAGFAGQGELRGCDVEFHVCLGDIRCSDGKVDDVLLGVRLVGALCPKHW